MLYTENKPIDEILQSLGKEKHIFLLGCNGCAEACQTGGQEVLSAMKAGLEKAGKKVDQTVEKAGDKVEKAGEAVKEKAEEAKEEVKKKTE